MAKHKYIETPEKLWEYFMEYKAHAKANPRKRHVFVGKDGMSEYEKLEVPLTIEGFEMYCFEKGWINDLGDYFSNKDNRYADYATICQRVKRAIRQDQIEGGLVGQYNSSITQRLNGLTEKIQEDGTKEVTIKVKYERKGNNTDGTTSGAADSSK